jgi:lipopolysaccharide export system protein LptA
MSAVGSVRMLAAAIVVVSVVGATNAGAQQKNQGPPNALQGFSQNRDLPVKINAAALEVREKDKIARFSGDVRVVQGDTEMRCRTLTVHYDEEQRPGGMKAAEPGPGGQQQIRRIEAKGGVVVIQKDQTANGDSAVFDMRANTVTLIGNVVVTRGQDILRGHRLLVDLTKGASTMESGSTRTGVEALIQTKNSEKNDRLLGGLRQNR